MSTTTWREEFEDSRYEGDAAVMVAVAPDESVLDVRFDAGFGGSEGPDILIWTADRVYFPVTFDGSEWLDSAPRNPTAEGQGHVGGE